MILISHRGNLDKINFDDENKPDYILAAIELGYDVEIDLWVVNKKLFLGHDHGEFAIDEKFLKEYEKKLWIHAKNDDALFFLSESKVLYNYFWHDNDKFVITSKKFIWPHCETNKDYFSKDLYVAKKTILVLPEKLGIYDIKKIKNKKYYGICSDIIKKYNLSKS